MAEVRLDDSETFRVQRGERRKQLAKQKVAHFAYEHTKFHLEPIPPHMREFAQRLWDRIDAGGSNRPAANQRCSRRRYLI